MHSQQNCPLDEKVKQKFQKMSRDGYNYEKLINLVHKHDEKLVNEGINLIQDAQSKTTGSKVKK